MRSLFIFLCFISHFVVDGILDGEAAKWHQHGYLVKVLARDKTTGGKTRGCTGLLVTNSLVLTTRNCVMRGGTELDEFVVILPWTKSGRKSPELITKKRLGTLLEVLGDKAVIQMSPLPMQELCPKDEQKLKKSEEIKDLPEVSNRLGFLPFRPSLFRGAKIDDYPEYLANCRVIGFDSNTNDFAANRKVLHFDIDDFPRNDGQMILVEVSGNRTACLGDTGMPVECMAKGVNHYMQMGLMTRAVWPESEESRNCTDTTHLVFTPLWDENTLLLLDRYDRPGFVLGDWLCKPWSPPNEELDEEETDEEPETTTRSRIHHDKHREKNEKNEKKSSPMIDHDEFQFSTLG